MPDSTKPKTTLPKASAPEATVPKATLPKATGQYLKRYAEPEIKLIPPTRTYEHCLVIPAFDEHWVDLQRVWQHLAGDFLVILVVNAPGPHARTLKLLEDTQVGATATLKTRHGRCTYLPGSPDILLVDRCTPGNIVDARQGVGLARKIGVDIALQIHTDGKLKAGRISITDADAVLPSDYFNRQLHQNEAALVFPFHHMPEKSFDQPPAVKQDTGQLPLLLYETSLLYYAAGLSWAGSSYDFTTLGSCMAINPRHYAQVRGYPKRSAAEDFYLLNKLAKTGTIVKVNSTPILLSGRLSERVPVGTGPGIRKISVLDNPIRNYKFYHPGTFLLLKDFQTLLSNYWEAPEEIKSSGVEIHHYWNENKLDDLFARQRSAQKEQRVFDKFVIDWFDAFRTLKFIHFMRQHYLPSVPLNMIGDAPFIAISSYEDLQAPDLQELYLQELRDHLAHSLFR